MLAGSLVGGLGNDVIFSYIPMVDNFWHAQGVLMITPRFPAYIGAFYVGWLYFSTITVWRLTSVVFRRESTVGNAALTGLLSAAYYAPWDVVGAKHLWWSWHTTDLMLRHRWLGVPVASTMFTLVFGFTWSLCLHAALFKNAHPTTTAAAATAADRVQDPSAHATWGDAVRTIAAIGCGSVPLMMVTMTVLQSVLGATLPPAPPPTTTTLAGTVAVLAAAAVVCTCRAPFKGRSSRGGGDSGGGGDGVLVLSVALLHFGFLMATIYTIDPASAVSTGVHQTLGTTAAECAEGELDLQGWKRAKYLCPTHMSGESASLFQLCDAAVTPSAPMEEGRTWSTFCGRANDPGWLSATTGLIAASLSLHLVALVYKGPGGPSRERATKKAS